VAGACLYVRELERRKQAEYDLRSVIIKGKVVDDRGLPVSAVEVDLVPLLEDIDAQSRQTVKEWTDKNGDYTLRSERTGRFFLAVLWNAPPSTKLPFLTRYYPDAPDQRHAETLEITAARHVSLTSTGFTGCNSSKCRYRCRGQMASPSPPPTCSSRTRFSRGTVPSEMRLFMRVTMAPSRSPRASTIARLRRSTAMGAT
jgi:hypothetical protein